MGPNPTRYCKIYFMDGQSLHFAFEAQKPDDDPTMGMAIEKLSKTQNLIFQLEDRLEVVPMNNVRRIEVVPVPVNLPKSVIRARLID